MDQIQIKVIAYFAKRAQEPKESFKPDTNLKTALGFSTIAWAQVAEDLSELAWMKKLGARIPMGRMAKAQTVKALTALIIACIPTSPTVAVASGPSKPAKKKSRS